MVTIGGTATDNVGVAEVTYSLTGATNGSGVASGTNSWTIPNLLIGLGTTVVTVTATDAVGNTGTDQIAITYSTSRLYVDGPYVQTVRGGVSGNGSTWSESFGAIQEAINFAVTLSPSETNPIEIWVADGTYYPEKEATIGNARSKTFWLEEYVGIYGHFQGNSRSGGGETDLTQRNLANTSYQTITSGDLGVIGDATDNAYHVFVAFEGDGVPKHFTMDGLTIKDGNCNNAVYPPYPRGNEGGGLQCSILGMHSITISNCTFSNNKGYGGSAISALSCGEITINKSIVKENESNGSAVFIGNNTKFVSMTECIFQDNIGNWGAALEIANMAGVTTNTGYIVDRCIFVNNNSTSLGGAISIAGYYATAHENRISRCMFYNNETAIVGGAIFLQGDNPHADRALLCINDCVFSQNSAQSGGAIANLMAESTGAQPALKILSCSFNQNASTSFGGAIYNNPGSGAVSCTPLIGNSIIWNQTAGGEIYNASVAAPIIYNCDIKGGATGTQVIDIDPLFINPADPLGGGLKLQTTPVVSNCINVGNNGLVPTWATTDITGNYARVQNSIVDLGAYENTLP